MLVNKLKYHRLIIGLLSFVLTGLLPNFALAFTLGDIRLNSALNEPLSANIELLELDGLNENQILVSLGSEADLERVGVDPLPLLNELEFEVDVLSASEGVVRVSSTDAIVEPYLNFVLNVRWPSGRVIREYTVLLDLPTFSANPTPSPAPTPARTEPAPRPASPAPQVEPEPVPPQITEVQEEVQERPAPVINEPEALNPGPETVVIQTGDSMWNIALATRPDNDVSVQQMMLAIQRANAGSDAFIGNNINGIRAGRVLRIPSRQEINAISQEQAITQVALQNQQFSNNAQPLAVNDSQGSSNNVRDELSIVNSTANDEAANAEIADLNATIVNLESELAFSEENLDRALLENEELRSRLNDLEEEIAILENIIAIEAQRMAELRESLAEQNSTEASDALAVAPPQNSAPAPVAPAETAPVVPPAPAPSLIANLLNSTLGMIVALVILLALIVGFLMLRNRKASIKEDDFDSILAEEAEALEEREALEQTSFSTHSEEDTETEDTEIEDTEIEDSIFGDETADEISEAATDSNVAEDAEKVSEQGDHDQTELSESEEDFLAEDDNDDYFADDEDTEDDFDDDEEPVKTGFLAGLFAKFSRKKADESETEDFFDDEDEDDVNEDEVNEEETASEPNFEAFSTDFDEDGEQNQDDNQEDNQEPEVIADSDEGLEEIVFDLDDSGSDGEIEFLDEDESESTDAIKEPSSLGNLGLDDAIAFDESDEDELEVITDQDEVSTKLDLAVAYHAMDDMEGAKEILEEVIAEGNEAQIAEAKKLLNEWGVS